MRYTEASRAIIVSFLLCLSIANTAYSAVVLGVPMNYQTKTKWCWAATSEMILDYYGKNYDQCDIVAYAINSPNCTTGNCNTDMCNVVNYMCSDTSSKYGITSILSHFGGLASICGSGTLSQTNVQDEIYGGRPFIIRWRWDNTNNQGHFLVVFGYNNGTLHINDPWSGPTTASYDWVVDGSNHEWTHTLRIDYSSPQHINISHSNKSGVNNKVEFFGCSNNREMRGLSTCRGDWWVNPCEWTSYCSTGWEWNSNDYYYTGEYCCFCSPDYVNIGHSYGSGVNNKVEFLGCSNNQEMHGLATCCGEWWVNPCTFTSYCDTGWEWNPNDYYYTGEDCSFCQ